ncbi:MAG TPA: hypothetical protein VM677_23900 [Actinokineospora sp.]|nr:hypothetical protein [Actinokineospora sp.]
MSVDEVTATLKAALRNLPASKLGATQAVLGEVRDMMSLMLQRSADSEAHQIVEGLTHAIKALGRAQDLIAQLDQLLNAYIGQVGNPGTTPTVVARPGGPKPQRPAALIRIDDLRRGLPPPVPTPNSAGKKTHGRWIDSQGQVRAMVSGEDETAEAAWKLLQQAGVSSNGDSP